MPSKSRLLRVFFAFAFVGFGSMVAAAVDEVGDNNDNDDDATLSNNDRQSEAGDETEPSQRVSDSRPESALSGGSNLVDPLLDEKSVVLITGAAGFLGSELAIALRRTYSVKKLLLVDNLGIDSENESAYVPPSPGSAPGGRPIYEKMTEAQLSMFEIKRQRAFRIFYELTASDYWDDGYGERSDEWDDRISSIHSGRKGAESIRFYRADMRPSIPEFFDFGEVPLLEGIFQSHPDITHVVHLADVPISAQNQVIPRNKDSIKTGPMEGLLEEFRLILERAAEDDKEGVNLPQFVYASSHEVYDSISTADKTPHQPNPPPFQEDKPITTPSSLHGTAKLIDEVLASAYHSTHGIYSVGLRFFPVYGPWDSPGTEVFGMADRIAALDDGRMSEDKLDKFFDQDVKDYVYVDDAVDAIMSAMQYRPPGNDPPPVVFNVGTGKGATLRELREELTKHYPKLSKGQPARSAKENPAHADRRATISYASPSRAESLLGFKAQVPLLEGLANTLAWHRDRSLPYGPDPKIEESFEHKSMNRSVVDSLSKARGVECSPLDRECLRGSAVFPCASECGRVERCTPSAWDDVAKLSTTVTSGCDAVLYTILLDESAEQIPSATTAISAESFPYVGAGLPEDVGKRTQVRCNIAFVSDSSPLVQRLRSEGEEYLDDENDGGSLPPLLRHGFWTVLPVSTPSSDSKSWLHAFQGKFVLEYLPKVSPGRFFGTSVRYAIFVEPSIFVDDLPRLLKRMEDGPPTRNGSTILMIPAKRPACNPAQRGSGCSWARPAKNDYIQLSAYNMIRVALRGEILGGGLDPVIDSSFFMHSLREEDARLFRCDVYGEAAQWGASSDERALEFIMSLHDLWSRAVTHWSGDTPWWNSGDGKSNEDNVQSSGERGGDDDAGKEEAGEHDSGNQRLLVAEATSRGKGASFMKEHEGTWMGILSSTEMQFFTHILPSEGAGIIHLNDGYPH